MPALDTCSRAGIPVSWPRKGRRLAVPCKGPRRGGSRPVGKKPERMPIWLRRLDLVAHQLRTERPLSGKAEARINMALSLMAEGLACLYARAEKDTRSRQKAAITAGVRQQMAAFRSLDADWIGCWRRERGRTVGR